MTTVVSPIAPRTSPEPAGVSDARDTLAGLRIAYLMNQHPVPSASFIRREMSGMEQAGAEIRRFAIRRWSGAAIDPADEVEAERTEVLLEKPLHVVVDVLHTLVTRPRRFVSAAKVCLQRGWRSDRGPIRTWIYFFEACRLRRRLAAENLDWVHAHFGTNSAAVAMFCRILGGPRYSFTVHGPEEFDRPEPLYLSEKMAHASLVIAISRFGRSQLYRWAPWSEWDKIQIVRCGISEAFRRHAPRPISPAPRLVCVARLAEQKGLPTLILAAAELVKAGYRFQLRIIGDGPLRPEIETMIRVHHLESTIELAGWQPERVIRAAIEEARALVLPSFAEGLPVVLMEALALGRPVISTRVAAIAELVEDGINGWLIDAGDVACLTAAMREALECDVDALTELGRKGATRVFEQHLADREAERLGLLIQQSLNPSKLGSIARLAGSTLSSAAIKPRSK